MIKPDQIIALIEQYTLCATEVRVDHKLIDDLGFDSLDSTELVMEIESEFNMEIVDEEYQSWKTVQDVINTANGEPYVSAKG